ncbi:hypothetical protein LTR36_007364 [Oleoguttula mirabilis]|uniref:Uncharacterized protein n=1 Tax=Oleoguttula mirabilis TaxID=1507867 RepID=A0AAV9J9Q0_9PEZI|nr:hypothetical protein LTR36_007364 [Oleoguttula mirabilis]
MAYLSDDPQSRESSKLGDGEWPTSLVQTEINDILRNGSKTAEEPQERQKKNMREQNCRRLLVRQRGLQRRPDSLKTPRCGVWRQSKEEKVKEERRRTEQVIALVLLLEEEERLRRCEIEIAAEVAGVAQEEEDRLMRLEAETATLALEPKEQRRQAQAAEEGRRARLQDCAARLEQHDLVDIVQVLCQHWYCPNDLRGKRRWHRE